MISTSIHSHFHDGISAIDAIIGKALRINELARIAKIETNLRKYIGREWDLLAEKASKQAATVIRSGSGNPNNDDIDRMMTKVDRVMDGWHKTIERRYVDDNREAYDLAHIAAMKRSLGKRKRPLDYNTPKATETVVAKAKDVVTITGDGGEKIPLILPSFNATDLKTIKAFEKHQVFWIGRHYKKNVSNTIADVARDTIVKAGLSREEAGKITQKVVRDTLGIVKVPGGFNGTSEQYFEGLVANAVTTQRVAAQITTFVRFGYTEHTIVNPQDQRTCEICELMDGKTFTTSDGYDVLDRLVNAKNPASVKSIQPFMTVAVARQLTGGKIGPISADRIRAISDRGNSMPPFHNRCFVGDTPVLTKDGFKQIKALSIGDKVLTHRMRWRKVKNVIRSEYSGKFNRVFGVESTNDHPYLILRNGHIIFDAVAGGDRVARVKKNQNVLRELWERVLCYSLKDRHHSFVLGRMQESKSSLCWESKQWEKGTALFVPVSTMRKEGTITGMEGKEVPFLFERMSIQSCGKRFMEDLSYLLEEILGYSIKEIYDLFFDLSQQVLETNWGWPKMWCEEGAIFREEESDVWPQTWSWEMGNNCFSLAGRNQASQLVGRSSSRLVQAERQTNKGVVPRKDNLYSFERNGGIEFVPIKTIESFESKKRVWNLTVDEDESFVVGESRLIVHNCRCSIDISEGQEIVSF